MGEEAGFMLDEGNEGAETETPHKAYRHRKKQLYNSIRKQMEFYFSDSNLTKDRFLGNLLKQDPCIDLSIFTRFNRIRALTTDLSDIAKALRHSELLSVTEDGTKVFRTKPVQPKENIDDCTIYVEQLPPDADHDWLRGVFSAYGNVAYVSIPKYRTSGKIKGFAFIEFETPEEANKTLEAFGARGCRLSSEIAPDKLCSITTFEGDEASNVDERNEGEISEKEDKKEQEQTAEKDSLQPKRKRSSSHKDSDNEQILEDETKSTQNKGQVVTEEDVTGSTEEGEDSTEENHNRKRKSAKNQEEKAKFAKKDEHEKQEESSNTKRKRKKLSEDEVEDEVDADASKKRRKLFEEPLTGEVKVEESSKKKRKKKQDDDALEEEESEDSIASKTVKTEVIENEDVAPENIQLDQSVKKKRRRETEEENRENTTEEEEEEEQVTESRSQYLTAEGEIENIEGEHKRKRKRKKKKKNKKDKQDVNASSLQILSKREWKRLRNKYLDLQRAKMKCLKQYLRKQHWSNQIQQSNSDAPESEVKVGQPRISYIPGVIVYAVLEEPVTDIRKFKADTKALQDVAYVDVLPGANAAHIRCNTAEGAKQLASSIPWVSAVVLKGEEEREYWDKIMADRNVKFSNKIRTKQRGRDKVLRRAERELGKHIKFDE